jgi:Holliday junction resolvase RusA-like endonuclease
MTYIIEIPGQPTGKGRPIRGKGKTMRTPENTLSYESKVWWEWHSKHPNISLAGPLKIHISAFYKIPKSVSKASKIAMQEDRLKPTIKPDIDNIAKIILDGLNGTAYMDDKQVVELLVTKTYSEFPRVRVEIEEASI